MEMKRTIGERKENKEVKKEKEHEKKRMKKTGEK